MKSEFTGSTIEYVAYIIVGALITTITLGLRIYCSVLYDKKMGNRTYSICIKYNNYNLWSKYI